MSFFVQQFCRHKRCTIWFAPVAEAPLAIPSSSAQYAEIARTKEFGALPLHYSYPSNLQFGTSFVKILKIFLFPIFCMKKAQLSVEIAALIIQFIFTIHN